MTQGNLFIISAPSGTGKTSLVAALVQELSDIVVSISHTTRSQRAGEEEGVNYFFVGQDAFAAMVAADQLLEHANVFGASYGTSKEWVMAKLASGQDVILEIDCQGAQQVQAQYSEAVSVFILPPSLEVLQQRLQKRKQDDVATIDRRMQQVQHEVGQSEAFDYLLVNDDFASALAQLQIIVNCTRLRMVSQKQKLRKILASFSING